MLDIFFVFKEIYKYIFTANINISLSYDTISLSFNFYFMFIIHAFINNTCCIVVLTYSVE